MALTTEKRDHNAYRTVSQVQLHTSFLRVSGVLWLQKELPSDSEIRVARWYVLFLGLVPVVQFWEGNITADTDYLEKTVYHIYIGLRSSLTII